MSGDRTALYRHWDKDGKLLYVGISLSAVARLAQHRAASPWREEIASVTVEYFATRSAACEAERLAIQAEAPEFNVQFAKDPKRIKRLYRDCPEPKPLRVNSYTATSLDTLKRIVGLRPLYLVGEAAREVGLTQSLFVSVMQAAGLQSFSLPNDPRTVARQYVTGWTIVEALEWLDASVGNRPLVA